MFGTILKCSREGTKNACSTSTAHLTTFKASVYLTGQHGASFRAVQRWTLLDYKVKVLKARVTGLPERKWTEGHRLPCAVSSAGQSGSSVERSGLQGQSGPGFCPSAVISVIASQREELLEKEAASCKPSSKLENRPGFNLSGGHTSGHYLTCLKRSVPI